MIIKAAVVWLLLLPSDWIKNQFLRRRRFYYASNCLCTLVGLIIEPVGIGNINQKSSYPKVRHSRIGKNKSFGSWAASR